jgi:hypothetical protein
MSSDQPRRIVCSAKRSIQTAEVALVESQHLATYLNDHLAGAVSALELMEHIERQHADSAALAIIQQLHPDVDADRRELELIIARLDRGGSTARKAVGWLSERLVYLKLRVDDPSGGELRLFEALELLSLGIEGKKGLWVALAATAPRNPRLQGVDYDRLIARAEQQRAVIEPARIDAARTALGQRADD